VLATNIDVLLSRALWKTLAGRLEPRALYRADRYDVEFPFREATTVADALEAAASHPLRYARRDGIYYGDTRALPIYQSIADLVTFEGGRGLTRAKELVARSHSRDGAPASRTAPGTGAGTLGRRLRALGGGEGLASRARALLAGGVDAVDAVVALATLPKLHVNACGDFTLLSRDDWDRLRGYPEWRAHSWHLDTIFMHQADASEIAIVELAPPAVVYHMEHGQGSGWTPEGHTAHFRRVQETGMHTVSPKELRYWKRELLRRGRRAQPVTLNAEHWGMAGAALKDVVVGG
jgi:hypothetical protein